KKAEETASAVGRRAFTSRGRERPALLSRPLSDEGKRARARRLGSWRASRRLRALRLQTRWRRVARGGEHDPPGLPSKTVPRPIPVSVARRARALSESVVESVRRAARAVEFRRRETHASTTGLEGLPCVIHSFPFIVARGCSTACQQSSSKAITRTT